MMMYCCQLDPQEGDAAKTLDLDDISEFRFYFFSVVSTTLTFKLLIREYVILLQCLFLFLRSN